MAKIIKEIFIAKNLTEIFNRKKFLNKFFIAKNS